MGTGRVSASNPGDVRLRALRPARPVPDARPRPVGGEASLLLPRRGRSVRIRLRDQGDPRDAGFRKEAQPPIAPPLPDLRQRSRAGNLFRRGTQTRGRLLPAARRRGTVRRPSLLESPRFPPERYSSPRRGICGGDPEASAPGGLPAHGVRCPLRRVPERRRRLDPERGVDGGTPRPSRGDLFDRHRRGPRKRIRFRPERRGAVRGQPP